MSRPRKRGFTLMELLVVLAIIGLLSAIAYGALHASRSKANDAKVKTQLSEARKSAEVYFHNNNGSYTASTMPSPASACTGVFFTDIPSGMNEILGKSTSWPTGTTLSCHSTDSAYIITASLSGAGSCNPSGPNTHTCTNYWCVDSRGASKAVAGHPPTPLNGSISTCQ